MTVKLTPELQIVFEKLVSLDMPDIRQLFRWDILEKEFMTLLCEDAGIMDTVVEDKSSAGDIGLNAVKFKAENGK